MYLVKRKNTAAANTRVVVAVTPTAVNMAFLDTDRVRCDDVSGGGGVGGLSGVGEGGRGVGPVGGSVGGVAADGGDEKG